MSARLWSPGLVAAYPMENNANDASGNGRHGTLQGSPSLGAGRLGQGLVIPTTSDYVDLVASNILIPNVNAVTTAVWFKTLDTSQNRYIVSTRMSASGAYIAQYLRADGNIRWNYPSGTGIAILVGTTAVIDGNWHFAAFVKDGNVNTGYVDCIQDGTVTAAFTSAPSADVGQICRMGTSNGPVCTVDEVCFWSRALTLPELRRVMLGWTPS